MFSFGKRGQEEAPFSLLLAVIMMAMVIPIAFGIFDKFQTWECETRITNNMEQFARELELGATLGGGSRIVDVNFAMHSCPNLAVKTFKLRRPSDCMQTCGDPNCMLLSAFAVDFNEGGPAENQLACGDGHFDATTSTCYPYSPAARSVCVRIPASIELKTAADGMCKTTLGIGEDGVTPPSGRHFEDASATDLEPKFMQFYVQKQSRYLYLCQLKLTQ